MDLGLKGKSAFVAAVTRIGLSTALASHRLPGGSQWALGGGEDRRRDHRQKQA
jgi:hypothetical protein